MNIIDCKCIKEFIRMCSDGYKLGFNEANGGNASYRMTVDEARECLEHCGHEVDENWIPLGVEAGGLAGEYFIVTASGSLMRNVECDPESTLGIVQLNSCGDAYRVVWGLKGSKPTSEFSAHILDHSVRKIASGGADRVMYHSHPSNVVALTYNNKLDDKVFTRIIWKSMTEASMVVPDGIGVLPWLLPGSKDLAVATAEKMEKYKAVVWAHHGLFVTGTDFDDAFGRAHTIDKSAGIYIKAHSMGIPELQTITDDELRSIGISLGTPLNEDFLE